MGVSLTVLDPKDERAIDPETRFVEGKRPANRYCGVGESEIEVERTGCIVPPLPVIFAEGAANTGFRSRQNARR